ncbi:CheB methylesterase [Gemmatirosa kalamazoonensis]|uniref:protein-glutamate methylesterase n=1 Tax=Gemmatirosa kalamazoonensis TaxID=861299 RepID=W0RHH6_9BACT|nr:chemotaxis protein CheB [Gemmatirosa kalamazoonensis]AHG89775.1 CheB methylesterase [Gemmatirosa kalamazoonensis]
MAHRDVIVVGASAGGVEVLKTLTAGLPRDFDAAVLIVLHIAASSPSVLPTLLRRGAVLPVAFAGDGEPLERGRIYLAPPDRHLVVEPGLLRLTRAPRENHSRPAIDPLFRSAALAYGRRVVGVILSGRLDDGTAGLWAVKDRGGTTVVQDPDDAQHPDMPRNALHYTRADHVVPADALPDLLVRLVREPLPDADERPAARELELEVRIAMEGNPLREGVMSLGPVSPYTCPECHGALVRVDESDIPRFRCHTGHAFSLDSLLAVLTENVETALWNALRAVEESILLLREAADRESGAGGARFEEKAREAEARAATIRETVLRHQALSLESVRAAVLGADRHAVLGGTDR